MKADEFFQIKTVSENIGKETIASNMEQLHFFDYDCKMEQDSFIHLIYTAPFHLTTSCTYEITIQPCYHFLYIYDGNMQITDGSGNEYKVVSNHLLFLSPSDSYRFQIRSGQCRFFQAGFLGASLVKYRSLLPDVIPYSPAQSGASSIPEIIDRLLHNKTKNPEIDTIVFSKWINDIFTEMCVYLSDPTRQKEHLPEYISEMKDLFDQSYQESYSLEDLEQRFEKSRYRLCREFSKHYGMSPIQYLNHRRIEEAKKLLLTTDETIHEIGNQVGIPNTNHFINLFKRETGATPLSFRQDAPVSISGLHYP